MSKHTKGTWYLSGLYVIRSKDDGDKIVTVRANQEYRDAEEDQANACLMATSPEMLALIEDINNLPNGSLPNAMHDEVKRLIAKATGEQNGHQPL